MEATTTTDSQQPKATRSPEQQSRFWQVQLHLAHREIKDFLSDGDATVARYKAEKAASARVKSPRRFNILYSNTETLRAAIYARTARPDVRQRFVGNNPVARQCAELIERALVDFGDDPAHDVSVKAAVQDALLSGRGVVRVVYESRVEQQPGPNGQMIDVVVEQKVRDQHIFWKDYRHSPARCWADVWWIAFRHRMTREDMRSNGFADADTVPLNWSPEVDGKRNDREMPDEVKRAEVWEIWDKAARERVWIVEGHSTALRVDPDPYQLEQFWPMPCDLAFIRTSDSHIPGQEFAQYRDLADDIDENQARISHLTKALKRRGIYDKTIKELARLAKAGDNEFIAVSNYEHLVQKGGLKKAFETEDIEMLAKVLMHLHDAQERLEAKIDKLTGVADVMRGEVDPREKLGQSQIKAQFGGLRLKDRQKLVQAFIRDLLRIKAELAAEHYEPAILAQMTQMEVTDEMVALLRSDRARMFSIDVETDSTVFEDAESEKAARVEVTEAMTGLLERGLMIMQAAPEMSELVFESVGLLLKTMKGGRQLEEVVDRAREKLMQRLSAPQQEQPNPQAEVAQIKAEAAREKADIDREANVMDLEAHRTKHEMRMREMEAQALYGLPAGGQQMQEGARGP